MLDMCKFVRNFGIFNFALIPIWILLGVFLLLMSLAYAGIYSAIDAQTAIQQMFSTGLSVRSNAAHFSEEGAWVFELIAELTYLILTGTVVAATIESLRAS